MNGYTLHGACRLVSVTRRTPHCPTALSPAATPPLLSFPHRLLRVAWKRFHEAVGILELEKKIVNGIFHTDMGRYAAVLQHSRRSQGVRAGVGQEAAQRAID
jgi:hypothetical protein